MCQVAQQLQLCSCTTAAVDSLPHYWILHRFVDGAPVFVIGEAVMPYKINHKMDLLNREILLHRVNEADAWDTDQHFRDGDLLQLSFACDTDSFSRFNYGFEYKGGKWIEVEYDAFAWMEHHEEQVRGEIKGAM